LLIIPFVRENIKKIGHKEFCSMGCDTTCFDRNVMFRRNLILASSNFDRNVMFRRNLILASSKVKHGGSRFFQNLGI
jgi:hypothetical protein